jgi:hypothetical protein
MPEPPIPFPAPGTGAGNYINACMPRSQEEPTMAEFNYLISERETGVPNLDCQWSDDLRSFAFNVHIDVAHAIGRMFPDRPESESKPVAFNLATYASRKADSMDSRSSGNAERAIRLENQCDRLYANLPEWARW